MADVVVTEDEQQHRYVAEVDGRPAGFVEYQLATDLVVITHTEVDPAFEGRGVGGALARAAVEGVRERGAKALVVCPFVLEWLRRHPEQADVLYGAPRSRVTD